MFSSKKFNAWKILDLTNGFYKVSLTDTRHRKYKINLTALVKGLRNIKFEYMRPAK
jgi:hypothetical protein